MPIVNLLNQNLRANIGFFGAHIFTNSQSMIIPSTTAGGTVVSTLPNNYGSVTNVLTPDVGGWSNWNPDPAIIPSNSKVEYAFLVWSCAYYPPVIPPIEAVANTAPILLTKPNGVTIPVTPNPSYNLNFNAGWWQFTHGAEITSAMQDNQYGDYKVTRIQTGRESNLNCGAWGIYIVYSNPIFRYRNVNLNVGATGFNTTVTVSDLQLPKSGPINASVYLESVQGDRGYPDSLLLNGKKLSGPYNPPDDFMNDKFVDYTGQALQSKGSLILQTGSVYGYYADQTVVSDNSILTNTDTTAVLTQQNSGDWAGVSFLGFLIDLNDTTMTIVKEVDKNYVSPGDTITYTLVVQNTGYLPAINLNLIDTLPSGLSFVQNSLLLNSIPYNQTFNNGITIPDLQPNEISTIVFKTTVSNMAIINDTYNNAAFINYAYAPSPTTILNGSAGSNLASTTVVNSTLTGVKSVNKTIAQINDILTYTIVLTNTGNRDDFNVIFVDTLPQNVEVIQTSFNQDGTPFTYSPTGSPLPNSIPKNSNSTISYKLKIIGNPNPNPILNSANLNYKYIVDPSFPNIITNKYSNTNIVSTRVSYINLKQITKYVDKAYATKGDILLYTIVIANTGNIPAENSIFVDTISNLTTFVPNSFIADGKPYYGVSPMAGINIGTISPNSQITITFNVKVN